MSSDPADYESPRQRRERIFVRQAIAAPLSD